MNTARNDIAAATLDTDTILAVKKNNRPDGTQQQVSLMSLRCGRFAVVVIYRFPSGSHYTEAPYIYDDESTARGKLAWESSY